MEVLLLQDIKGVGEKNDLIVVGDGFALNCLLPKRAALVATPLVRRRYADAIRSRAEERDRERQAKAGAAQALAGKAVCFTRKATKTGKLYAAISEEAIASALKDQHGLAIAPTAVQIGSPIKALGTFHVMLRLGDQNVPLSVSVQAEAVVAAKIPVRVA